MLTLAEYLASEDLTAAEFARRLSLRKGETVSDQNVSRWCRDFDDPEYGIPEPANLIAIYFETKKQVPIEVWYRHLLKRAAQRRKRAA